MQATEALERFILGLDKAKHDELISHIKGDLGKPWYPDPDNGPQLEAYLSEADLLLYGGAAGGGKTDLLIGCALEAAEAVIFRRQYKDLQGIEDRLKQIIDPRYYKSGPPKVYNRGGVKIELDHLGEPGSELSHQGRPRQFVGFDEGAQLNPYRVNFVMGWLRSATGARCRAVIATNPPTGGEGAWLLEWFAPWIDPMFPNPAKAGEIRWGITVGGAEDIRTVWVPAAGKYNKEGLPWSVDRDGDIKNAYDALSRTFVPAKLDDNKYLKDTQYRARVNAMPEPLRSQLLNGDFMAGQEDDPWQVIPSEWVRLANDRWTRNKDRPRKPMTIVGVDVAQGGKDFTELALLRDVRFEPLIEMQGKDTPDPVPVVNLIMEHRRDGAGIVIDHGGGYGGGVSSHLRTHLELITFPFVPGSGSGARTRDKSLGFINLRAECWWTFREALDPGNPDAELIELPPDAKLKAQLTAPRWTTKGDSIKIEDKDEVRKRLGTSTDRADAVLMAWYKRKSVIARKVMAKQGTTRGVPIRDPLAGYYGRN